MLIDYAHILLISVLVLPLLSAIILWMLPSRLTRAAGISLALIWGSATCCLLPALGVQTLSFSLPLGSNPSALFNVVVWRAGIDQTGLLIATALSVSCGMLNSQETIDRVLLFLLGFCSQIVAVSDDVGSWISALVAGSLCLAVLMSEGREPQDRQRARALLSRLSVGSVLLFTGWAMLMAIVSQVKAAPFGTPGPSTSVMSELSEMLTKALARHPAAIEVWAQYELLPVLIIGLGVFVIVPLFPFELRFGEGLLTRSSVTQVAVVLWSRIVLMSSFQNVLTACQPSQFFSYFILAVYVGLTFQSLSIFLERDRDHFAVKLVSWSAHFMCLVLLSSPFVLSPASVQIAFASQTIGLIALLLMPNSRLWILSAIPVMVVPLALGLLTAEVPSWGAGSLSILFLTGVVAISWGRQSGIRSLTQPHAPL